MDGEPTAAQPTAGKEQPRQGPEADFAEPLGSRTEARLVVASGADALALSGDLELVELYRAHFEGEIPGMSVHDGIVTIQYRLAPALDRLLHWRRSSARVTLNGSIAWEIEFHGGVSGLAADLGALPLRSLDLTSASQADLTLPRPAGVCYVHFAGSASDVVVHRPAGVAVRFQLNGSATDLSLDEQYFGAIGGGVRWQSADYGDSVDRYEISVLGSVSKFAIDAR